MATSAFSPPESSVIVLSCLPGGCTLHLDATVQHISFVLQHQMGAPPPNSPQRSFETLIDFLKFSLKDCSHLCGNTTDNLGQLPLSGQDIIPLAGQIFISLIYTGKLLNGPKIGISQCGDFAPQL